jgi:probable HAF family extracellular repeat protein
MRVFVMKRKILLGGISVAAMMLSVASAQAQSATRISLNNGTPSAISADGKTIVGSEYPVGDPEPFYWTLQDGVVKIPIGIDYSYSYANAVSDDGTFIAITGENSMSSQALRFSNGSYLALGYLAGANFSEANDISGDGSVIVGRSIGGSVNEAYRWEDGAGMTGLGTLGSDTASNAHAVSADGTTVVGSSSASGVTTQAFRWTQAGGMVPLGDLAGGRDSFANDVTADGNVIVGYADSGGNPREAFRWVIDASASGPSGGIMTGLGTLPGTTESFAKSVSASGAVIVGTSSGPSGDTAFRWVVDPASTHASGGTMQSLSAALELANVDVSTWQFKEATGISADGQTIVGVANENGVHTAYIASFTSGGAIVFIPVEMFQSALSTSALADGASTLGNSLSSNALLTINYSASPTSTTNKAANLTKGDSVVVDDGEVSYFAARGYTGASRNLGNGLSAGGGLVFGYDRNVNLYQGGEATTLARGGDLHMSYAQADTGFSANVVLTGLFLDGDMKRGYLNGSAGDVSKGEADGFYFDVGGRLGYEFELENDWAVTPFGEYHYSRTSYDNYQETSGSLPGVVSDQSTQSHSLQGGVSVAYTGLADNLTLWAESALGLVREDIDLPTIVTGSGTFGGGSTLNNYTYGKATVGLRYGLSENTNLHASFGGITELGSSSTKNIDNLTTSVSLTFDF